MTTSTPPADGPSRIVVGVDGSAGSQAALDFALAEAAVRGAEVRAVCSWEYPVAYGGGFVMPLAEYEEAASEALAHAIAVAADAFAGAVTPTVSTVVREGHPAAMLTVEAEGAAMLVVGSRGHGGFVGLLLGSVSQHCVTHATCPVVVVPAAAG